MSGYHWDGGEGYSLNVKSDGADLTLKVYPNDDYDKFILLDFDKRQAQSIIDYMQILVSQMRG